MQITGTCHCGAITLKADADPQRVIACHCKDCQAFSGAPFRAVLAVEAAQVSITGSPKHYEKIAASGNKRVQAFCADCGCQLYATEPHNPATMNFRLGWLDQREQLVPKAQIWHQSSMPWLAQLASIPAHEMGLNSPLVRTEN